MRQFIRFVLGFAAIAILTAPTIWDVAAAGRTSPGSGFYESALRLIDAGDDSGAVIELKNALAADPGDISARILLGRTYLKLNNGASAAKELLRARRDGASDRYVLAPLGRAYLMLGQFEKILKEIRAAAQDEATAAEIAVIRGNAELSLEQYDSAERTFTSALAARPGDADAIIGLARVAIAQGDLEAGGRHLRAALKARPKFPQAWFLLGKIAQRKQKTDAALDALNRALELDPRLTSALIARAGLSLAAGRYDDAETDIRAARDISPRNARAAYLHSLILAKRGKTKEAEEALIEAEQLLQAIPAEIVRSHAPTMLLFGTVNYLRANIEPAYQHLSAYLERDRNHAGARIMLARIALQRGQPERAVDLLKVIAPRLQNDIEFLFLYSDALIRSGRNAEAAPWMDRAAAIAKPETAALSRLVALELAAGRNAKAIALLKTEIARNPGATGAAVMLATTFLRQKDFEAALATARRLVALQPDSPVAHNLAGGAYHGLKNFDEARASFEAALKIDPDYVPAILNLGKLEGGLGNLDRASRYFRRILDKDPHNGQAMLLLAELHRRHGDLDGTYRWLEKARASSRQSQQATLRLIDLNLRTNRADEAVNLAQELHRLYPNSLEFMATVGRAQHGAGQIEAAAELFRRLSNRAKEAGSTKWLYKAAVWLKGVRDPAAARAALENLLKIDSGHIPAHLELFRLDIAMRKYDDALAWADRVEAMVPEAPTGDMLRGEVRLAMRQFDEAAQAYGAAFRKKPGTALAAKLYEARRRAGRHSLKFLIDWAARNPGDRTAQRLLGAAYTHEGRVAEGIALYERLLDAEPDNVEFLNNIAILYQRKGDARAVEFARRAHESSPAHAGLMDTYGWILVQRGETARGLKLLREAHLRAPELPEIRYHMAVALNATGQTVAARRELRAALDESPSFDGMENARKLLAKWRSEASTSP